MAELVEILVITGATATGKTALSIDLARELGGEIISMDSRQLYQGMNIGTAKPTAEQQDAVPHHGLDLVDPSRRYSAGAFARDARGWIAEIEARGHVPMLVGGTGFYLRALTDPLFAAPDLETPGREELNLFFESKSPGQLLDWLSELDPVSASNLAAQGGRQRVTRALEVAILSGKPLSWWHAHATPEQPAVPALVFVLELAREELYRRINERVIKMVEGGLVDEVRGLMDAGYDERAPGLNATGYIEMVPYLKGEYDLATAIDAIQRATRRYARRQLTWFRHQLPPGTIFLDASRPQSELVAGIVGTWKAGRAARARLGALGAPG